MSHDYHVTLITIPNLDNSIVDIKKWPHLLRKVHKTDDVMFSNHQEEDVRPLPRHHGDEVMQRSHI